PSTAGPNAAGNRIYRGVFAVPSRTASAVTIRNGPGLTTRGANYAIWGSGTTPRRLREAHHRLKVHSTTCGHSDGRQWTLRQPTGPGTHRRASRRGTGA